MTKDFFDSIKLLESKPPENCKKIRQYLNSQKPITFFSWKLPQVTWTKNGFKVTKKFNSSNAVKFSYKEKQFIKILRLKNIKFRYLKIIPDDTLIKLLELNQSDIRLDLFRKGVKNFFSEIISDIELINFTDLIKKGDLQKRYDEVFGKIIDSFDSSYRSTLVDRKEFLTEVAYRSQIYNLGKDQKKISRKLARNAFALFSAETYVLYLLNKNNILPNLILIAGERSVNTYKYEFFRQPKNRPVLPKLFVI